MASKSDLPPIPATLADVAMIDGPTCAASAGVSLSAWHERVRAKQAPQPVIRRPRFTRWRLADVREYLAREAQQSSEETSVGVIARAAKASAAAKAKRATVTCPPLAVPP